MTSASRCGPGPVEDAVAGSALRRLLAVARTEETLVDPSPPCRRWPTRYAQPVNYLDGGAPVGFRLRGRQVRARAEAVSDHDAVAEALTALVRDHPP